jgi:FkbM family methyltransferase
MTEAKIWDWLRPIHAPFTRFLRRRFGRNYFEHPEMELPPAYEAVQLEIERRLHLYLHISREEIEQIVIVGAHEGHEITRMRHTYPHAKFLCFEPSPQWFRRLKRNFDVLSYVESRELALSEKSGTATFHELPLAGNGSLLDPDMDRWAEFNHVRADASTSFQVRVGTLDEEAEDLPKIDLLWMDVQGAEGNVLKGASETLQRTSSVFLEVALCNPAYRGTMLFREIDAMLSAFGFSCVLLGTDGSNFGGNALWIQDIAGRQ